MLAASAPDLAWYTGISQNKGMPPRCPFASVHRCPRFYQSLSLLGEAGTTKIDPDQDKELHEKWKKSDLWPATQEQATWVFGPGGNAAHFVRFCPEVIFERFGLFASSVHQYVDEADRDLAHARLTKNGTSPEDSRWVWANADPMHYSECPLYSLLPESCIEVKAHRVLGFAAGQGASE